MLGNKRSHRNEKPVHLNEEKPPLAATRESLCTATKTQCSQKKKKKKNPTMRCHFSPTRMVRMNRQTVSVGEDVEKEVGTLIH